VLDRVSRHEPADRPPHEREPREVVLQPAIASRPQEDPAHQVLHAWLSEDRRTPRGDVSRMIGERRARIRSMTQFYDLDAADAAVPELDRIMTTLVDQRAELIR